MTDKAATTKSVSKQNIGDGAFKVALLLVGCVVFPFLYYAHEVYHWGHANKPAGYKYPEFKQLWMTGVGVVMFGMLTEFITLIATPLCRACVPKKAGIDEYIWQRKVNKAVSNCTGFVYFSISTFWGYAMLKNSVWLPAMLGGQHPQGSMEGAFVMTFPETPPGIHCYIFITYGYHVQDFIKHLMKQDIDNDWREMLLHHIAAVALYPGFIFGNVMGIGVVLAWLHDIADITVNLCRLFNGFDWAVPAIIFYIAMIITWAYTRLYILPSYIIKIFMDVRFPENLSHFNPLIWLEMVFLMIMQVLHIYWFMLFLKMGYRLVTKGERKEIINNLEDAKVQDAKKEN